MRNILFLVMVFLLFNACKEGTKETKAPETSTVVPDTVSPENSILEGNYTDESYAKRSEGYDWVGVSIRTLDENSISVSVRSRADKKRPTCTFDTKAYKEKSNVFRGVYDGHAILFSFSEGALEISSEDEFVLSFFCNGGASLAGIYNKIEGSLDESQVDPTSFSKVLNLQGIGFNVSAAPKNKGNILSIYTLGLEGKDYNEAFTITGEEVVDAEVEDLNSDGSPELLVFTQSKGSGSYGKVYAFSVNNMKSMSQVYFPPISENKNINQGYMGHDEFSLIENTLVHRFPIYKAGDTNAAPTGGTRQIGYKLVEGEAMRKLEVASVSEY